MSDRKQTPDVLADILGAGPDASSPPEAPSRAREPARRGRAATTLPVERPRDAGRRGRWQYLVVSCQDYRGWRPRYEDGAEIAGWTSAPPLISYLERRGQEGWELVSATSGKPMFGVTDCYQLFFKRPAE
jgi:hypothetical protein